MNTKKADLFTTYEVDQSGYCVNIKGKPAREILKGIEAKIDPTLLECLEYFKAMDTTYDADSRRVIVYSVRGGSEGYYMHVDSVDRDGKLSTLILAKTLGGAAEIKDLERAIWDVVDAA